MPYNYSLLEECEEGGRLDIREFDRVCMRSESAIEHSVKHCAADSQHKLVRRDPLLSHFPAHHEVYITQYLVVEHERKPLLHLDIHHLALINGWCKILG